MTQDNQTQTKQISYVNFIPRIFSAVIDTYLINLVIYYPMKIIARKIFTYVFEEPITAKNIDISNDIAIQNLQTSSEFIQSDYGLLLESMLLVSGLHFLFASLYFIYFWHKFGTTPAKYIFGIRVVDANTMGKLSITSCIKRIFGLIFAPIGIWFIFFTEKKQALHDKICGSVVIKK